MALQTMKVRLRSRPGSGFLMHNVKELADPLSDTKKRLSAVTGKRKKTDADQELIARIEWGASLYLNAEGRPVIPYRMLKAMLHNAAKKTKDGPKVRGGVYVLGHAVLEYDGPKDEDALYEDKRFVSREIVKVQMSSTVRCRPFFEEWEATAEIEYEDTLVEREDILAFFHTGGAIVGIGDWRPDKGGECGRFTSELIAA